MDILGDVNVKHKLVIGRLITLKNRKAGIFHRQIKLLLQRIPQKKLLRSITFELVSVCNTLLKWHVPLSC